MPTIRNLVLHSSAGLLCKSGVDSPGLLRSSAPVFQHLLSPCSCWQVDFVLGLGFASPPRLEPTPFGVREIIATIHPSPIHFSSLGHHVSSGITEAFAIITSALPFIPSHNHLCCYLLVNQPRLSTLTAISTTISSPNLFLYLAVPPLLPYLVVSFLVSLWAPGLNGSLFFLACVLLSWL